MATAALATSRIQFPYKLPLTAPNPKIPDHLIQTVSSAKTTWENAKEKITREVGRVIRDAFFMPMPMVMSPEVQAVFEREEAYFVDFLNPAKPLDRNFRSQDRIREQFTVSDQQICVKGKDGRDLIQTCRIFEARVESPASNKDHPSNYTYVFVAGNLVTIHNNIVALYPYLEAFLDQSDETTFGRFVVISQNDLMQIDESIGVSYNSDRGLGEFRLTGTRCKPDTIDEAGFILTQTLLALSKQYGKIDQVTAHSLGGIVLAGALDYLSENKEAIPHHILIDRGPSSIEKTSKLHWGGSILSPMADLTGWGIDVGKKVSDFFDHMIGDEAYPEIVISSVVQDHHFSGEANLYMSPQVQALQRAGEVFVAVFNPTMQIIHENGHHSLRSDSLIGLYLVPPSTPNFLNNDETLAERVMSKSLETRTKDISELVA